MSTIRPGSKATHAGVTRREVLRLGAAGLGGLAVSRPEGMLRAAESAGQDRSVIMLLMVGGPSQLETWDPKPDAPAEVRGPHRSIATRIPGVRINEHLPRLAQRMNRLALIRSVHHDAAPIHETGHQLLQTGRLSIEGREHPHIGSLVSRLQGRRGRMPASVVLPGAIGNTGVLIPHGQTAGWLGAAHDPFTLVVDPGSRGFDAKQSLDSVKEFLAERAEPRDRFSDSRTRDGAHRNPFDLNDEHDRIRDEYGRHPFGQSCLLARRLVESGVRVVTVNMFETVFNRVTWDCHGSRPFSTLDDYANEVLPMFDQAFSALLDDLERSGRLESTMVLATGEFGRSPKLNTAGGRDHWPDVWSAALAGGGIRGGQVIGASDATASTPADRPVAPPELVATLLHGLEIDPSQYLTDEGGGPVALVDDARPIDELFV